MLIVLEISIEKLFLRACPLLDASAEGEAGDSPEGRQDSVFTLGMEWVRQNIGVQPWDRRLCARERLSLGVAVALSRSLDG